MKMSMILRTEQSKMFSTQWLVLKRKFYLQFFR